MPTKPTAKSCFSLWYAFMRSTLIFMALHLQFAAFAQTYYFDTYGPVEGLSSKIYCLLQDKYHNLWMGTPNGVARFDGNSFLEFNNNHGMASQGVKCMMMDSQQNIWFGHWGGGISIYNYKSFQTFDLLDTDIDGDVTSIFEDFRHRIWVTTSKSGAFLITNPFRKKGRSFRQFLGKQGLSDMVFDYCMTAKDSVYLITELGVRKFIEDVNNPEDSHFKVFYPKGFAEFFNIITMFEDKRQDLWFGTHNGGLYKYDHTRDTVYIYDTRSGLSSDMITAITQDSRGNLWIGSWGNGVCRYDGENFKVFNHTNGLDAKDISDIIEDVEGNILIASHNKGLAIYKGDLIENYGLQDGLKDLEVYAILKDYDGDFWIGTDSGVSILPADQTARIKDTAFQNKKNDLTENSKNIKVRFLKMDANHTIWIGTLDDRVYFCDSLSRNIIRAFPVNRFFSREFYAVTAMEIDQDDYLWVGTNDGLLYCHILTGEVKRHSNESSLIGNDITAIYCDRENRTWIGAYLQKGISQIENQTTIMNLPCADEITPTCFVLDHDGKLWVGTRGQGIYILENKELKAMPEITEGLLSNLITTLNVDDSNTIYIGTNKGLNVFDTKNHQIKTYNKKNGFLGIETNPSASYYNQEAKSIWYGTNMGVNLYNIAERKISPSIPLVYITQLRVNQQKREIAPRLRLRSSENQITIDFKSICLTNSDAVQYKVILDGLDKNLEEITTLSSITYQSLPPGRYTFKVMARNSDGIWSTQPALLSFEITKPFYKRWYVILSAALIIFLVLWLYVRLREKQLVKEKRVLEDRVKVRTLQLEEANLELEEKNKDITDSIRYALRIQLSILPPEIPFANMFVLFKPKDIVSGDFYWITRVENKEIIAAVDCTGHGVPGAFMSFIGYSALNEVAKERKITQPAAMLNALNDTVMTALNLQGEEAIKDGMDIALITYDSSTRILEYAGAYNPLYLVRDGELIETKADRFAIGKSLTPFKEFTNHSVKIKKGDTIYIFSDGYADQFGGEDEKKFKAPRIREMLLQIQDKDMPTQKHILDETLEKWRGDIPQVDDVLFIGRRFN
ncbi:MAG: SpoIIE family protein phosphatase [Bacteroidales bacterium]|nr:SpoIIE family protein phosphatase [Bacteroidales bacterium]